MGTLVRWNISIKNNLIATLNATSMQSGGGGGTKNNFSK